MQAVEIHPHERESHILLTQGARASAARYGPSLSQIVQAMDQKDYKYLTIQKELSF